MQDVIWLSVCLGSIAVMGAFWFRDRRNADASYIQTKHLNLDLSESLARLSRERDSLRGSVTKIQQTANGLLGTLAKIHELASGATGADETARPILVGDPDEDPLSAEISLFGPEFAAVYVRSLAVYAAKFRDQIRGLCVWSYGDYGVAKAYDVEDICDAVRLCNDSFHRRKEAFDAGAKQEAG